MALSFFRRNQKMVIGIMVVLMVAFLVGVQGCDLMQGLLDRVLRGRGGPKTKIGRITQDDINLAEAELMLLGELGLGQNMLRMYYEPFPTEGAYLTLRNVNERDDQTWAYALLLAEAKASGVLVTEADVDRFFQDVQLGSKEAYRNRLAELRASPNAWTEGVVRGAVHDWLLINKYFGDAMVNCRPSEAELRVTFRDLREQINLRVMPLEAKEYLKDVPDPNEADVQAHFNLYRTRFARETRQVNDMGFGYRQPPRARLQYLVVRGDVIGRVTRPGDDALADYYNQNKGEFVKKVPDDAATRPGATTQPRADANSPTQPASRPMKEVQMDFAEAKPLIIEKLRPQVVQAKLDEVVVRAEGTVRMLVQHGIEPDRLYDEARKTMMRSADKALAATLKGLTIQDQRLDEAVQRLAEAAELQAICYPWGTHDGNTLEPSLKVSLRAEGMTLGAALEEISRQLKGPTLHWASCDGFKGVLFSVRQDGKGVEFFPLRPARTPLRTPQELLEDEVLSQACINPAGGRTLLQTAFSAEELSEDPKAPSLVKVGQLGPRMYLRGEKPGRVIWRLAQAVPGHVPAALADQPDLRKQVVDDLKLQAAFQKALEEAEKLANAAKSVGLETVAGARKKETLTTGLFARRWMDMRRNIHWSEVPGLKLDTPEQQAFVITKGFELMPQNVEPNAPEGPPAVGVAPLPVRAEALVMERIGFRPVVRPEYEKESLDLSQRLMERQQGILMQLWFHVKVIRQRVGYPSKEDAASGG
jgi:hypothetical protein